MVQWENNEALSTQALEKVCEPMLDQQADSQPPKGLIYVKMGDQKSGPTPGRQHITQDTVQLQMQLSTITN
ncbi:hypothetical protein EXN66_Car020533 [Channa argus]|uniref:Uncharacterized protein n=1 Tax=Channa argus TaxID=215402 RepID=A0A6G1QRB8_CHAAH|nr:hypothetical protein EXN66_Car020533 [Channa argus]